MWTGGDSRGCIQFPIEHRLSDTLKYTKERQRLAIQHLKH